MRQLLAILLLGLALTLPGMAACGDTPLDTVQAVYQWYMKAGDHWQEHFAERQDCFEPKLYKTLSAAIKAGHVDWDVFNGTQQDTKKFVLGQPRVHLADGTADVPVTITPGRGSSFDLSVNVVRGKDGKWRIVDITYKDGSLSANLR